MKKKPIGVAYTLRQAVCGIKVGDIVKCTRIAEACEEGWQNSWHCEMNEAVGKLGTVVKLWGDLGIEVEFPGMELYRYPYFVLKLYDGEKEKVSLKRKGVRKIRIVKKGGKNV